jgi:hypothetical protein
MQNVLKHLHYPWAKAHDHFEQRELPDLQETDDHELNGGNSAKLVRLKSFTIHRLKCEMQYVCVADNSCHFFNLNQV